MPRLLLLLPLILTSCLMRIQQASPPTPPPPSKKELRWPDWKPVNMIPPSAPKNILSPSSIKVGDAHVITYGPRPDATEHFAVVSQRELDTKPGIYALRQCFLPTSIFAGPSPLQTHTNTLFASDRKWFYSAYHFRSTFFDLYPALTDQPKGLLVYHTSIMLLSIAEKQVITNFRKRGWNIVVALPPDSLYRTRLPAISSTDGQKGTLQSAAKLVAEDMDRHYLEQARSTHVALDYLAKTRPDWLTGPRVLMGTSAGTFAMPAEALINPGWDALIFVSGGTNLLSLYESGSAGLFKDTLKWVDQARQAPPHTVSHIYTDEEYHEIFRRAAPLTRFHSGNLARFVRDHRILMIAGTIDHIMPDEQAHALHQALGSPERWTAPLGHHLIALQLILEVDRIDHWIDAAPFVKNDK